MAYLELRETGKPIDYVAATKGTSFKAAEGAIAVLPMFGVIGKHMGAMDSASGGCSIDTVSANFDAMMNEPTVSTIVLQIDSPGGSIYGVPEFADKVFAGRESKQIIAVADSMAASAAYWIGAAAGTFVVTPSGDVGSVGVLAIHIDDSGMDEKLGVKKTVISAGKFKDEGWTTLSEDAKSALQQRADNTYGTMVKAIAKYRGVTPKAVDSAYGEGRVVQAAPALAAGMVDRIASFDQVLSELTAAKSVSTKRAANYSDKRRALAALTRRM